MDVRDLRSFVVVARELHVTRTSELHVAQSALSQQIAQLERELGVLLVDQTEGPAFPSFVPICRDIVGPIRV
jgi:DNA-binding transcriptional LysR family regulator